MSQLPITPICYAELVKWLDPNAQDIQDSLTENKERLSEYQHDLLLQNEQFANENPMYIVEDLDFNKRLLTIFFVEATQAALDRNNDDFNSALTELFDYFKELDKAGRTQIMANAWQMYPKIIQATLTTTEQTPAPENI